ncbi:hypothetical protein [Methylobacterium sp. E-046]|uniref:hypothetical protein n=1 Tax=Methylobacterium sp. E-046 TaxID=2836576 RepID=UPI001FBA6B03|nr:hypothetical protein [Methylobacterium sp. E-046]MCJ2100769.1 hypothetical protein [Methylobacterium sp. E-046]
MPKPSDALLHVLLAKAEQDLAEAERRRDHQARVVYDLRDGTDARVFAEKGLREIERTIGFIRANRELIEHILA